MSIDKKYQGIDANLETSLEEYGFVARLITVDYDDEHFVIYKMGDNQYGSGHIRESELDAIVKGNEWADEDDVKSMLDFVGLTKDEWFELPFETKFSDLVSYWGTENVIGTDYYPNDKNWAFEEIGLESDDNDNDDLVEYIVPTHYVTALLNSDGSGLSFEDIEELAEFVDEVKGANGNANFMLGNDEESYFANRNDINALGSDVMKLYIRPSDDDNDDEMFAKGGMVKVLDEIKENGVITENQINLIKRRLNSGKDDSELDDLLEYINDNSPKLSNEQNKKGYEFLMNLWKSPTGKERKNSPFGYREESVLENFEYFELAGFLSFYGLGSIPIYNVIGKSSNTSFSGSFQYYYDGKVNIIGEDGGMFANGGGVGKKSNLEYPKYRVINLDDNGQEHYEYFETIKQAKQRFDEYKNNKIETNIEEIVEEKDGDINYESTKYSYTPDYDDEQEDYAKGGGVGNVSYEKIYGVLKENIDESIDDLGRTYENSSDFKGEEVEHKFRDGFIPYTNGGYEASWFEYVSMLNSTGYSLPTEKLQAEMQRQIDYAYELAKDTFKETYPEIVDVVGEDNIDYNSLDEAGFTDEAQELSDWEMENISYEDSIYCSITAYYYEPTNDRGQDGKHTISLQGVINLEAPYHRAGKNEDFKEIIFTFDSIEELDSQMNSSLKQVIDWFNGDKPTGSDDYTFKKGGDVDNYNGKKEKIINALKKIKGGIDNKAPKFFERNGLIYVSAENGDNYADYYNYMFIDEKLEDLADSFDTYWDWENAGSIVLSPITDDYANGGQTTTRTISYKDGGLAGLVDEEQMRDISFKIKVKTMPKKEGVLLHEVVTIEEYEARGEKNINLPPFHLIYGDSSLAIFDAFSMNEIAGLKREDAVEHIDNLKKQGKTERDGSFMAGLTNFAGDEMFMFFNVERLNFKGFANRVLPHEALHLARYLISLFKNEWMRNNLNTPNWWEDKRATFVDMNDDNEEFFAETLERTTAIAMDGWFRATGSRCMADGGDIGLFKDGGGVEIDRTFESENDSLNTFKGYNDYFCIEFNGEVLHSVKNKSQHLKKLNELVDKYNLTEIKQKNSEFSNGGGVDDADWIEESLIDLQNGVEIHDLVVEKAFDNYYVASNGDAEFLVFISEEEARKRAIERVKEDLEYNPEYFNRDWLMNYIDGAFNYFNNLYFEMSEGYVNDIESEDSDEYENRLVEEMVENGIISDEETKEEDFDYNDYKEDFIVLMTDEKIDEGNDGIDYYISNFGEEQAFKIILDNDLIDIEQASEGAIYEDGIAHFLAPYDSTELLLNNGKVAYRTN